MVKEEEGEERRREGSNDDIGETSSRG